MLGDSIFAEQINFLRNRLELPSDRCTNFLRFSPLMSSVRFDRVIPKVGLDILLE